MTAVETKLPYDTFNANLRAIGRGLSTECELEAEWRDGELGLVVLWPDGECAWVGFGPIASALVMARNSAKH